MEDRKLICCQWFRHSAAETAQTAWVKGVSMPQTSDILGLKRLNIPYQFWTENTRMTILSKKPLESTRQLWTIGAAPWWSCPPIRLLRLAGLVLCGLLGGLTYAATYTLPNGTLPSGCTKVSNTSVSCSNLSLAWADAIVVSNSNLTLAITNTLTVGGNNINTSSPASGFTIQANVFDGGSTVNINGAIIAVNKVTIGNASSVTGNITSTNDQVVMLSASSTVTGNITAKKKVSLGSSCSVTGDISTDDEVILLSANSTVTGNITAKKKVTLESSTSVTGNVTSLIGDVELKSSSASVNQCVTVDRNQSILLDWHATVGGVCCLSNGSCSGTSCVTNNSGYAMPGVCSSSPPICVVDNFSTGTLNPSLWNTSAVSGSYVPAVVAVGGSNRLRLTQAAGNQSTMAQLKKWYPGGINKIVVEFDYFVYGGSGADGVAVVFSDAGQNPSAGGFGGSLGYAQRSGVNGFVGGWLGVGLDEFGNFPTTGEGRTGYPTGYTPPAGANSPVGVSKNNISVRGSGSGTTGYPLLANTGTLATPIWQNSSTSSTVQRFRITIDHSDGVHAYVSVQRDLSGTGNSYSTLVAAFDAKASASQAAVPANWLVSFTGSTGGSHNIHELTNLSICATSVTDPAGSVNAAAFDCVETGQNTPWNATARKPLFTKLAGTGFGFDIAALKADGTLASNYVVGGGDTRYAKVDLYDDTTAPACVAVTPLAGISTVVAFKSGTMVAGGRANRTAADVVMSMTVPAAYKKLRCRVRECTDATCSGFTALAPACSSDQFAVRPAAFLVTKNTPTLNAGSGFTLQAVAVNSNLTSTSSTYTGTPVINRSQITGVPGFTSAALLGDLPAATAGISFATMTYDDVGSFTLPATSPGVYGISDSTFTSVDSTGGAADCIAGSGSNVASGGKYGCLIGQATALAVGPFTPDHFELSAVNFTSGCQSGGFTYMDQPFSLGYTITAKSLARPSPAINPPGNTALKLYASGQLNHAAFNGSTDLTNRISLAASTPATPAFSNPLTPTWINGSYVSPVTSYKFTRPTTLSPDANWGPFDALNLGVSVVDPAGVGYATGTKTFSLTRTPSALCASSVECKDYASLTTGGLPTKERFGRVRMENVYGSELLTLPVPIKLQYWNGGWTTNTIDTCTSLSASNFGFVFPVGTTSRPNNLSACETGVTMGGSAPNYTVNLSKPGSGNTGWTDMTFNLDTPVTGIQCLAPTTTAGPSATAANFPWLLYNWDGIDQPVSAPDGTLFDDSPKSRATFGVYKSPLIYRRENY